MRGRAGLAARLSAGHEIGVTEALRVIEHGDDGTPDIFIERTSSGYTSVMNERDLPHLRTAIVAALIMAAACAWGLGRRLTEYR